MDKIRVAVIGLGNWGECHVDAYKSLSNVEVVALCDIRQDRLQEVSSKYQVNGLYTDSDELLKRNDIDLVSVATTEEDHLRTTLQALNSGIHVLVEKPIATKLEEAKAMLAAAELNKRHVIPGHLLRFEPRYSEIKQAILSGQIGQPESMYFRRARTKEMFKHYNRTHTVYLSTIHDLDLAIWYSGNRVKTVKAYGKWLSGSDSPDILWSCLEFENGTLAFLQSNWMTPESAGIVLNDAVEIIGKQGNAQFENRGSGIELWDNEGRKSPDLTTHRNMNGFVTGVLRNQLQYICDCIATQSEPDYISFEDAVHGIEVANAIVRSAAIGKEINLYSVI